MYKYQYNDNTELWNPLKFEPPSANKDNEYRFNITDKDGIAFDVENIYEKISANAKIKIIKFLPNQVIICDKKADDTIEIGDENEIVYYTSVLKTYNVSKSNNDDKAVTFDINGEIISNNFKYNVLRFYNEKPNLYKPDKDNDN